MNPNYASEPTTTIPPNQLHLSKSWVEQNNPTCVRPQRVSGEIASESAINLEETIITCQTLSAGLVNRLALR